MTTTNQSIIDTLGSKVMDDIAKSLSKQDIFRFTYVPFVVAELVWDYADTVLIFSKQIGKSETKRLARAIKEARKEYRSVRFSYCIGDQQKRLEENMLVFESALMPVIKQMTLNLTCDIRKQYPDLLEPTFNLIHAITECNIMSSALLKYVYRQAEIISRKTGVAMTNPLPKSFMIMHKLIPEFYGDKTFSERFGKLRKLYVDILATKMGLVTYSNKSTEPSPC